MDKNTYHVPCIYPLSSIKHFVEPILVPGSKSITNRALLLATLAEGNSTLDGVLFSDDSRHFLNCIQELGFQTKAEESTASILVTGQGGRIPRKSASLYVGSAGTAARFLTALLGVSEGSYYMDASEQMRRRPMAPLLASLRDLGCEITCGETQDCFPFTLHGHGFLKDFLTIDIEHSSQFLSALLIASALSPKPTQIQVKGTHGMSYIHMTCHMMKQFGVMVHQLQENIFEIPGGQSYQPLHYQIEPDVSAACYFYALTPLLQVPITVQNVHIDSLQGDVAFLRILEQMGCWLEETPQGIRLNPPINGILHGVDVNMSSCSDQAITLAALAPFADSPTTIRGIGHIRYQESNRIAAIVTELAKMNILCKETEHNLTIYPGTPKPSLIETYEDHRMAMGFTLIGLRVNGMVIQNPFCCRKTFENYYQVLENTIAQL